MATDETQEGATPPDTAGEQTVRPNALEDVFRKVSGAPSAGPAVPVGERAAAAPGEAAQGGFTQLFQSLSDRDGRGDDSFVDLEQAPLGKPGAYAPDSHSRAGERPSAAASHGGAGEFTRMFQSLRSEGGPDLPGSGRSTATAAGDAGFTQLLRTLSDDDSSFQPSPLHLAPSSPEAPLARTHAESGPGEFTRVISGSMLREAQGRMVPGLAEPRRSTEPTPGAETAVAQDGTSPAAAGTSMPQTAGAYPTPTGAAGGAAFAEAALRLAAQHEAAQHGATPQGAIPQGAVPQRAVSIGAASALAGSHPLGGPGVPGAGTLTAYQAGQPATALSAAIQTSSGEPAAAGWSRYLPLLLLCNLFATLLVLIVVILLLVHR